MFLKIELYPSCLYSEYGSHDWLPTKCATKNLSLQILLPDKFLDFAWFSLRQTHKRFQDWDFLAYIYKLLWFCNTRHVQFKRLGETIIQVTLDGLNSDLSKFSISRSKTAVPFFYSIKQSKFTRTHYLSNFGSLEVLYLSNQDLGPVIHISLFFTLNLSKSGRLYTPVKRVIDEF